MNTAAVREEAKDLESAARMRAAFREVALGAAELSENLTTSRRNIYRPICKQGETDPYNVDADWEERA